MSDVHQSPEQAKIVVATDGSDASLGAATRAAALFGEQAHYVLVYVAPPPVSISPTGSFANPLYQEAGQEARQEAEEVLRRTAGAMPVEVRLRQESGDPARVICQTADQEGADVIVVGARGLNRFQRALLGTVSGAVMHHAGRAVLVVPTGDQRG